MVHDNSSFLSVVFVLGWLFCDMWCCEQGNQEICTSVVQDLMCTHLKVHHKGMQMNIALGELVATEKEIEFSFLFYIDWSHIFTLLDSISF